MENVEWQYLNIEDLSLLIRKKEISPVEIVQATLNRIHELQPKINAFITVLQENALEKAKQAEQEILKGMYKGPLHGIPFAVKDNIFTKGIRTTVGSKILEDFITDYNATVVNRLEEAGAILVGKTNMHEFAYGVTNINEHYGSTRNPWNPKHMTGGSSGGSAAAVSSSCVPFSLGSDTGGSVRIPSALCGVVGFKPSFGRVSKHGVWPLSDSMDHVGVITRTVHDTSIVMKCIAGWDTNDSLSINKPVPDYPSLLDAGIEGMRIGVPESFFFDMLDSEVYGYLQRTIDSIRDLGGEIIQVDISNPLEIYNAAGTILHSEAFESLNQFYNDKKEPLGQDVRDMIEMFGHQSDLDVEKAKAVRNKAKREWDKLFEEIDVMVTPGAGITAPALGDQMVKLEDGEFHIGEVLSRSCMNFNLLGIPALVIPVGFSKNGLPISMQLTGRLFQEESLLCLAHNYEKHVFAIIKTPPFME